VDIKVKIGRKEGISKGGMRNSVIIFVSYTDIIDIIIRTTLPICELSVHTLYHEKQSKVA